MGQFTDKHTQIHGTVAAGFESVRQLFEKQTRTLAEHEAQLCVYHRGEKVVDLWAASSSYPDFNADTLVNIFSSGKSLEAIAISALVSKGLIDYDAKITDYWPEFGAQGKEGLTVADLMRHEAGLASFDTSLDYEDLFAENIKQNAVGQVIEGHAPSFKSEDDRREYHALTRGWIVNELFRRVEPDGRTIGEFFREEISGPLQADVVVGVSEEEMPRRTDVKLLGIGYHFLQSVIPRFLGRRVVHNFLQIMGRVLKMVPLIFKNRGAAAAPPPFVGATDMSFFNEPGFAKGETPSANANCSARGLAKVGAMVSGGGTYEGREFISDEAYRALHANPLKARLGGLMITRFTQGGVDKFVPATADSGQLERDFSEGREGFYGWMGFGGSIFQWHPEKDISFAFVPSSLHFLDFLNERGKNYQAEVLKCVDALPEVQSG